MILEDLLAYTHRGPIIAEGSALLPALLYAWDVPPEHALFLIPTKSFQIAQYSQRPWVAGILNGCTNPTRAFENWMERDHRFGQRILQDAIACGYQTIIVNGGMDIDALYDEVKNHFKLS